MEAATAGGGELRLIIATPKIGDGFPDATPEGVPRWQAALMTAWITKLEDQPISVETAADNHTRRLAGKSTPCTQRAADRGHGVVRPP
jgi:hypothetical protein